MNTTTPSPSSPLATPTPANAAGTRRPGGWKVPGSSGDLFIGGDTPAVRCEPAPRPVPAGVETRKYRVSIGGRPPKLFVGRNARREAMEYARAKSLACPNVDVEITMERVVSTGALGMVSQVTNLEIE